MGFVKLGVRWAEQVLNYFSELGVIMSVLKEPTAKQMSLSKYFSIIPLLNRTWKNKIYNEWLIYQFTNSISSILKKASCIFNFVLFASILRILKALKIYRLYFPIYIMNFWFSCFIAKECVHIFLIIKKLGQEWLKLLIILHLRAGRTVFAS